MDNQNSQSYSAFSGHKLLVRGPLDKVVLSIKKKLKEEPRSSILAFSDSTGKQMDFDLQGSEKEVLQRLEVFVTKDQPIVTSGPGRPKLGVVSREISLLPRHWEWLSTQSGGASVTLRRLVDEARKNASGKELIKLSQERTYKFMTAIAGDLPQYEEALRALFSKDKKKFESHVYGWPKDLISYIKILSDACFEASSEKN